MSVRTGFDIVICGAGIAGAAAAYYLSRADSGQRILVLDRQPPLSLTTARSGENFRAFWPQECMAQLCQRSIALMEHLADDTGETFNMKYSGYEYVTRQRGRNLFDHLAHSPGLTRLSDHAQIRNSRPYLDPSVCEVVRDERAGSIDVNAMGSLLLRQARISGVTILRGDIQRLEHIPGTGFIVESETDQDRQAIRTDKLLLAAGPFNKQLAAHLGVELPFSNYLQRKIVLPDPDGLIPGDMPFTILADAQSLNWDDEEQSLIRQDPEYTWLLDEFPAGLHIKPEPGCRIKLGWAYNRLAQQPLSEPPDDPDFASVVMRGASQFIPSLKQYVESMPTPVVSFSGYYSRTEENWPLIGPVGPPGLYTIGALSGFGTMAACAAAELCTNHMNLTELPAYARWFHPDRYDDPMVREAISLAGSDGQL
jgi:glycine/D-amino acid oxidase-like deaminating enzyme